MLEIKNVHKTFNKGTINEKKALNGVNLHLDPGDFVTIIGGNGAGKSTTLNMVAGVYPIDQGTIILDGKDISDLPEYKRAYMLGRVFQDPMMGTAAGMQIEENMAMANRRGKKRGLSWGITKKEKEMFKEKLQMLDLGLEDRMTSKVGLLSGGQRQALTLLMATLKKPSLLLLDEHTAALDPKTAKKVLDITEKIVARDNLTTMMVTHNMKDAINIGNRLIMMSDGKIIYDVKGEEKKKLKVADLLQKFEEASGGTVKSVVSVGPEIPEGFEDFQQGIQNAAPFVRPSHPNSNDDISLMYFTSGTTGNPKMVAHDFTYPLGHIVTGSFWHNLHKDSLHLTIADTGWGKAVWGKLYGQWIAGATVFVYDHEKFTPADMLQMIQDYRITSLCAPPTIFRFLIREDMTKYDLSSLQYCTIAGEALNPAVFDTFYKLTGIKLMEGFGQTETTLTVATFPWMEPKPGSMGVPNPQYDVDLLRPDGSRAEDGEQGQIVIHTTNGKPIGLFKEYYRDAERTREAWHDGLYYTGDVAWRDEDGYLWFVGRADDVIKSSGYRIGPFEVESALMTHPAVVECAITGVPDEIRGQVVKATIVLAKDYKDKAGDALVKELQNHVKRVTAPYKYPRVVEFVDELPKTISGKIRRVEIRDKDNK